MATTIASDQIQMSKDSLDNSSQDCELEGSENMRHRNYLMVAALVVFSCLIVISKLNNASPEDNMMENDWILYWSFFCQGMFVLSCLQALFVALTNPEGPILTRKHMINRNRIVLFCFGVAMLIILMLFYDLKMDWYSEFFLCAAMGYMLVAVFLVSVTCFEVSDKRKEQLRAAANVIFAAILLAMVISEWIPITGYARFVIQIGGVTLNFQFIAFHLTFDQEVNDETSNDAYVANITPSSKGPDFQIDIGSNGSS